MYGNRFSLLSILMPVYNERYYVEQILEQVLRAQLPEGLERELIIVDDGSTDGTRRILESVAARHPDTIRLVCHEQNQGKGAAVRTAVAQASGDICIIQDADLEYDPRDYPRLLAPILSGDADVVYGSRFAASEYRRVLFFWHAVMNGFLTTLSNVLTDLNLTDMETCYKAAKTGILKSIPIRCSRFGIEPELTAKFAKRNCRIYEVPVSYRGRTYDEGKKITWWDGLKAVFAILYYGLVDDLYDDRYGHDILHSLSRAHRFNAWMADTIKPWVGETVLEIGAGMGNLSVKLLPRSHYVASDVDPLYLDFLESRFGRHPAMSVRKVDLTDTGDFSDLEGRFDSVVCLNVLEHVEPSETALRNIRSALAPGGTAVILVPQGRWLYGSLDRVLDHKCRYSREGLVSLCRHAGFSVETVFSFNRIGVMPWFVNGRILGRKRFSRLQLKVFDAMVWLWRALDVVLPWPGLSIVCVVRKPANAGGAQATG